MSEQKDILCLQKMALNNAESHCTYKRMGEGGGEKGEAQRGLREEGEMGRRNRERKKLKNETRLMLQKLKLP